MRRTVSDGTPTNVSDFIWFLHTKTMQRSTVHHKPPILSSSDNASRSEVHTHTHSCICVCVCYLLMSRFYLLSVVLVLHGSLCDCTRRGGVFLFSSRLYSSAGQDFNLQQKLFSSLSTHYHTASQVTVKAEPMLSDQEGGKGIIWSICKGLQFKRWIFIPKKKKKET